MDRSVKNSIVAGLATFTIVATVLMPSVSVFAKPGPKLTVTICHSGNGTNFTTNHPDATADVGGHDGHDFDIIPPFDYEAQGNNPAGSYPGKNWTTQNQAIWENDCVVPTSTSTPTPSSTSTPTPTPVTPTPTPETPIPTPTPATPTPTPATPTPTPSDTPTLTPSDTPTPTPSNTPTPTSTPSETPTPSDTPTSTPNHHHSGGSSLVESPTPSPSVEPTETPVILGASTQLPATGLSVIDALVISLCAGLFAAGAMLAFSSVDTKHLFAPLR
jgi:hypothetical protein